MSKMNLIPSLSLHRLSIGVCVLLSVLVATSTAVAELERFLDQAEWEAAVNNNFVTIDFTGYEDNTPITDQYAHLGAHFTTFDVISGPSNAYPNDQWGLQGFDEIMIEFDMDVQWVAIHFPGLAQFEVWRDGLPIEESQWLAGGFGGIISDEPFDAVRIWSPASGVISLDDFHFGPPIPGPGALAVLALAGLATRGRRRR